MLKRFYLKAARSDEDVDKTAKYLAVLALLGHEQLCYWPSTVAASLVSLACLAENKQSSLQQIAVHSVFPNIYTSMKEPSRYPSALIISFSVSFVMYTAVVAPVTKFALTPTPIAYGIEELLPPAQQSSYAVSIIIRTILMILILLVALTIPYFGVVMALTGSVLEMLVSIIFPCACYLRLCPEFSSVCLFVTDYNVFIDDFVGTLKKRCWKQAKVWQVKAIDLEMEELGVGQSLPSLDSMDADPHRNKRKFQDEILDVRVAKHTCLSLETKLSAIDSNSCTEDADSIMSVSAHDSHSTSTSTSSVNWSGDTKTCDASNFPTSEDCSSEYEYEYETKQSIMEDLFCSNSANNSVLSSGRWNVNQDTEQGTEKLTIDKEFEQYFSMLML
ncbi:hypothetical protein L1987_12875 [Smallanthus sonchifolius]|uniref:Uncharacterized protein n=1 Tax=Smallanthus sonchifolius TaxID=185202 RepID=A0ACB9JEY5_9ASTR|nr:hypothetical protein L1987_12875 [Smallanthus sonchifolius]